MKDHKECNKFQGLKYYAVNEHQEIIAIGYSPDIVYTEAVIKGCTCPIVFSSYKVINSREQKLKKIKKIYENRKQRELIQKELNSEYPKWSLIIDYAMEAREIDYPGDTSHLLELSGLAETVDKPFEYQPPKIEEDDDFWSK